MNILRPIVVSLLFATAAWAEDSQRITITGEGQVEAAPDMATITLGVSAEAETAKAAMDETSARVAALLQRLGEDGVEARDIQTSDLSLNPVWDHRNDQPERPRISGFSAANTVTVRVRALDNLGGVLDGVLEVGANTFNGLSFGLQDPQPTLDEARKAAVADARRKAELYAMAAGVTLGGIASIAEDHNQAGPQPMFRMEAAMDSGSMPVAAGELSIAARVIISWDIAP